MDNIRLEGETLEGEIRGRNKSREFFLEFLFSWELFRVIFALNIQIFRSRTIYAFNFDFIGE